MYIVVKIIFWVKYLYFKCSFKSTSKKSTKWSNNGTEQRHPKSMYHKRIDSDFVRYSKLKTFLSLINKINCFIKDTILSNILLIKKTL